MFYDIPTTLNDEINELDSMIQRYMAGDLDAESLKGRRVPFGCYEQRETGKYMLRIRCPGGALTPGQLFTIAMLSSKYGSDFIHITTRQEFQIHDLKLTDVVPVVRQLRGVELATRGGGGNTVRNITVSADAGVAPDEAFDPSPQAFALTSRLIAEPDSWALPRKFKIAFSNSAKDSAYAQFHDLGFIADTQRGEHGFRVYVAGGMGSKPEVGHLLHRFIPVRDVYLVAEATKRVFSKFGNRKDKNAARLRFLWKQLGESHFRKLYERELQQLREQRLRPLEIPEESSCAVTLPFRPAEDDSPQFELWKRRYVTAQRQPGLCSIVVPVFLGNLDNDHAIALAGFLDPFGKDVLRATLGQNLCLRNIPEDYLGNVYASIQNISELSSSPTLLANSIACAGADTCQLGICLSKGALRAVRDKLMRSGLDLDQMPESKLRISGCPNTCGQHLVADLGFYGKVGRKDEHILPAYGVVAGALTSTGHARFAQRRLARLAPALCRIS